MTNEQAVAHLENMKRLKGYDVNACKFCGGELNGRGEWRACTECGKFCREKCNIASTVRGWHFEPCISCKHNPYRQRHEWNGARWEEAR